MKENASQKSLFDQHSADCSSKHLKNHALLVEMERISSNELKNQGAELTIFYSFKNSLFGEVLIASTSKGLVHLAFFEDSNTAFSELQDCFPKAKFITQTDRHQKNALKYLSNEKNQIETIQLHLKGTDFQLKTWRALLKISFGKLTTYGELAIKIKKPKAARAVGTAIGNNPIAFIIPCHRVVQSNGGLGGYRWGKERKRKIIEWERC